MMNVDGQKRFKNATCGCRFFKGEKTNTFGRSVKHRLNPREKSMKIMTYIKSGGPACSWSLDSAWSEEKLNLSKVWLGSILQSFGMKFTLCVHQTLTAMFRSYDRTWWNLFGKLWWVIRSALYSQWPPPASESSSAYNLSGVKNDLGPSGVLTKCR